jgi:NAD(P)-dependent dehydrogenase (short-subunit alcohol dehydrogenase family)
MSKRVLITGTSTGFGRSAVERLARRGDHVFATMRDIEGRNRDHREALERLAAREGLRLRVLPLDVVDQKSVDAAVANGVAAEFVQRVNGVFKAIVDAPDAPGSDDVVDALVNLIDMKSGRPFRTVVSAPIQQLLGPYNAAADALRPIVAQIFSVPELAGSAMT